MENKKEKEICPTCGHSMKLVESEEQTKNFPVLKKDEEVEVEAFDISEIWHCLNCSEEWQSDIRRNIWRKNEITE